MCPPPSLKCVAGTPSLLGLISCSVHDNEDGKTYGNFGVINKNSLILEDGRDSVERPQSVLKMYGEIYGK